MLARQAVSFLNHLLEKETWARERLRRFAGQHARLAGGPLRLELAVDGEGYFRPAPGAEAVSPAVVIELPGDAPLRFLADRESAFAAARISGAADFAEVLAFVFRHLRWDVEEDLAGVVGDILAHRLVRAGRSFLAWQRQAAGNLAANAAEYLGEESGLAVSRREMERFRADVEGLRGDLARLEARLARLG